MTRPPAFAPLPNASNARHAHDVQDAPWDLVLIEGLRIDTVIGIHDDELHRAQPLVIDLQAGRARARACDTDRIDDTIDYARLCERLRRLMVEHRLQLLEALAERIASIAIDEFGAQWVRVRVCKPRKLPDVDSVGVQIERRAAPPQARPAGALLCLIGSGMVPDTR